MVARLKLKEIDGRAPPGVKPVPQSLCAEKQPPAGGGRWCAYILLVRAGRAGNTLKLRGYLKAPATEPASKGAGGLSCQVKAPGMRQ